MRSSTAFLLALVIICLASSFTLDRASNNPDPCSGIAIPNDIVIGTDVTIKANLIFSTQTISQNSNVIYRTGSGAVMSTNSLLASSGPSSMFQVFTGSTLTVEIDDCL